MDLDTLKVNLISLSAISLSMTNINEVLQSIALILAIIYTLLKIYQRLR